MYSQLAQGPKSWQWVTVVNYICRKFSQITTLMFINSNSNIYWFKIENRIIIKDNTITIQGNKRTYSTITTTILAVKLYTLDWLRRYYNNTTLNVIQCTQENFDTRCQYTGNTSFLKDNNIADFLFIFFCLTFNLSKGNSLHLYNF